MTKRISIILLLLFVSAWAQGPFRGFGASPFDSFELRPLNYFVGEWSGHETGVAGIGQGDRKYEWILDGKYLFHKNLSHFEPQEKNPEGEDHGDWAFFSYDNKRHKVVLREFHSEGFINQYVLDSVSADGITMVFISEAIENGPNGMRARAIYTFINHDEFDETFELAMPGKEFELLLKNHWTRKAGGK